MQPQVPKGRVKRIHILAPTSKEKNPNQPKSSAKRATPPGTSDSGRPTKRPFLSKLKLVTNSVTDLNHCDAQEQSETDEWCSEAGPVRRHVPPWSGKQTNKKTKQPPGTSNPRASAMQHPTKERIKLNATRCRFPVLSAEQVAWRQVTPLPSLLHFHKAT